MRVVCPFTRLMRETVESLGRYAPQAEFIEIHGDQDYHRILADLWEQGESFTVVEHDIEIHGDVIPQFEQCLEPWCVFPFSGGHELLYESLGCTRFSSELLRDMPTLMSDLPHRHWYGLDTAMGKVLKAKGYGVHVHSPPVLHRHPWKPPAGHIRPCPCPNCKWLEGRIA